MSAKPDRARESPCNDAEAVLHRAQAKASAAARHLGNTPPSHDIFLTRRGFALPITVTSGEFATATSSLLTLTRSTETGFSIRDHRMDNDA